MCYYTNEEITTDNYHCLWSTFWVLDHFIYHLLNPRDKPVLQMKRLRKCSSLAQLVSNGTTIQTQLCLTIKLEHCSGQGGNTGHRMIGSILGGLHSDIEKIVKAFLKYKNKSITAVFSHIN